MTSINLYEMHPETMDLEKFKAVAARLGLSEDPVQTSTAIAVRDEHRALAYAQPGARFGGLLFFTDQSETNGESETRVLGTRQAERWVSDFNREFDFALTRSTDRRIRVQSRTSSEAIEAVTFDGEKRHKVRAATEVHAKMEIDRTPVTGPRAKAGFTFRTRKTPDLLNEAFLGDVGVFEERELVPKEEVLETVEKKLRNRRGGDVTAEVKDVKLAYFAGEFTGGRDVLAPYYFVEVELTGEQSAGNGVDQGPRQLFWIPAYR